MAEFCRDYLEARRDDELLIVDLGSCDYNGSYRPIFTKPRWRYLGVDLAPGKNVDLILREAYDWRELKSESVDALISGQTFEHTEYFWETMLEIARVLKPGGLCCLIAPATGNEHRFPVDCWRFFTDGFRALARYAQLEVVHSRTHWEEEQKYDLESNKWHESILIARKPPAGLGAKIRRRLYRAARRRLHPLPKKIETMVQLFFSSDGVHREEQSIVAGTAQGDWETVRINLPANAEARPLRIDFMRSLEFIDIAEMRLSGPKKCYFAAAKKIDFDACEVGGDAERIPHSDFLRLRITGADPQLYLQSLDLAAEDRHLSFVLRLRVHSGH